MRLIDADKLIEQLKTVDDEIVKACIGVVQSQPTVDTSSDIGNEIYAAVTNKLISLGTDLDVNLAIQNTILDFIYK